MSDKDPGDVTGKWNYGTTPQFPYGEATTYQKAMAFLDGPYVIEDWGCLPSCAKVQTEDGVKRISWIVKNKYYGKVLSINDSGRFVWNSIVSHQSERNTLNKQWVRVKTDTCLDEVICTSDHPCAVVDDPLDPVVRFIPASETLKKFVVRVPKDRVDNRLFNKDQVSVLLGNMLGDGTISKGGQFRLKHGLKQYGYLEMNAGIFNISNFRIEPPIEHVICGRLTTTKESKTAVVNINGQTKYLRKIFYPNGVKIVPEAILKYLNDLSLAFWYMDDGNIWFQRKNKPNRHDRPIAELNTHCFTDQDLSLLCDWFKTRYGISPYYRIIRRHGTVHKVMLFRVDDSDKIYQIISKYVPEKMQYKLPVHHRNNFNYHFDNTPLEFSAQPVKRIKDVSHYISSKLFDITVANDHNFVANRTVVHNCGTAWARKFVQRGRYMGIDGSWSMHCDQVSDLRTYQSKADAILMRHLLEHNYDWKKILENALASFQKKFALVMFTPFSAGETHSIGSSFEGTVPDLSFKKQDLLDLIGKFPYAEESVPSATQYGFEHVFYIARSAGDLPKTSAPAVSVIIPTAFAKLDELLRPCLETLIRYTDLGSMEVIVVANGCPDGTEEYVRKLGPPFRLVSFPDALGFTKATNEGIKAARGKHLVLLNNDILFLEQPRGQWLEQLLAPFKDNSKMGITGPLQFHDYYSGEDLIVGACLAISREALAAAGGRLDEVFSPGGGEDVDLCCKVRRAGYVVRQIPKEAEPGKHWSNVDGTFMLFHKNNQTFKDIPGYWEKTVKRNGLVNMKRYNRDIRLCLGARGEEPWGYLSVDVKPTPLACRAPLVMDIRALDFGDQTVSEILSVDPQEYLERHGLMPHGFTDTLHDLFTEWRRVLKPDGKLVVEFPAIDRSMKSHIEMAGFERVVSAPALYPPVRPGSNMRLEAMK